MDKELIKTLKEFIDDNDKLITSGGVFFAIILFTMNIEISTFSVALSFLFLTISILIWFELISRMNFKSSHASMTLVLFKFLLIITLVLLILYWFAQYKDFHVIIVPFVGGSYLGSFIYWLITRIRCINKFLHNLQDKKPVIHCILIISFIILSIFLIALLLYFSRNLISQILDFITS